MSKCEALVFRVPNKVEKVEMFGLEMGTKTESETLFRRFVSLRVDS